MTTVVKLGGSLLDDSARRSAVLREIARRWNAGEEIVLVHGGGKHIDAEMARAGLPKRTHAGLRITDDATLKIVVSVLAGTVNKMLVSELTALGVRAAGLSGCDGGTLVAAKHPPLDGIELGHVGIVTRAHRTLAAAMLNYGILPVISSIAQGHRGELFNVNADSAAAAVAASHGAARIEFLTDVEGVLDAAGDVVSHLDAPGVEAMLASPAVTGGMRPKLQAVLAALAGGVPHVAIGCNASAPGTTVSQPGGTMTKPSSRAGDPRRGLSQTVPASLATLAQ